jgi:acyl-CoA thioester hydrolase
MPLEAPISRWQEPVQDPWIDYNGHLNVAYYALIFDNAMDVFYRLCGLGELYKKATGLSTFAVECHIGYQREGSVGDEVRVTSQLLGYDEKRLHYFHTMYHVGEGYQMATQEQLAVHVDLAIRKVVPFTEGPMDKLAAMWDAHKDLPVPAQVGSVMKIKEPIS